HKPLVCEVDPCWNRRCLIWRSIHATRCRAAARSRLRSSASSATTILSVTITRLLAHPLTCSVQRRRDFWKEDAMEQLIRQFGTWLKQGFGWLIDVFVYGCVWGISQISRLLGVHVGASADSLIALVIAILLVILLIWLFYAVIWRFVGLIRWALEQVAYAL